MRILIIGGTAFVGRHLAQAALDAGHELTLFHRGQTGAGLFPQAVHLTGDRDRDMAALRSGQWDATIDVCGYVPRQVRSLAEVLDGRGGQQLFISSMSAYRTPVAPGFSEATPLAELADPDVEEITEHTYGGLKVACERTLARIYGPGVIVIRPTYVIGPHDYLGRLTWWVERLARGGEVLAPGDASDPIQVIDARDLASWAISLLERSVTGTFNAVSPPPPFGFGDLLSAIAAQLAPSGTTLNWVGQEYLLDQGEDDTSLPMWPGANSESAINAASPAAALAAGLAPRPLRQSIAEIHDHQARHPAAIRRPVGLSPEREAELLAGWARH